MPRLGAPLILELAALYAGKFKIENRIHTLAFLTLYPELKIKWRL
jgi:hypothetical protein